MLLKPSHRHRSRGIALVTALLLLSLFTIMTLAMVIATSSDLLIDGYYRNLRGSFYAADSGLNAARQYLANSLFNSVTNPYPAFSTTPPIPSGVESTIIAGLGNSSTGFGGTQSILSSSGPQASAWPGTFTISYSSGCATTGGANCPTYMKTPDPVTGCTVNYTPAANLTTHPTVPTCTNPGDAYYTVQSYTYAYPYKITAVGNSTANQKNTIEETGVMLANVALTTTSNTSFAAFGTLFDQYPICSAGFVKGTMSGKFFSNDSWNFGDSAYGSGNYIFTGSVGAANAKVGYMYGDGTCDQSSATSDNYGGTTIAPTFQGGLNLNQTKIPLPADSYSQQRAVLDGIGACTTSPCPVTPSEMNADHLTNINGTVWPASGAQPSTGVYVPYTSTTSGGVTTNTFTGGGIYVQGNADQITLSAGTGAGSTPTQVFTIKQGTRTTTVTVNLGTNTTTIADNSGAASVTMNGVPQNLSTSPSTEAAMLFVNGSISGSSGGTTTGLSGPSSGPAIQNGSAVTITATGNVAVTGNLLYSTEPVSLNAADTAVSPPPTNVLGIFTTGGDVQMQPPADVSTMEIDASIATISTGGSGGLIAQWNHIGTLTIVGGRVQNQAKSGASLGSRNIWFDQRFSHGFAPPWFPTTTVTTTPTTQTTITPSRVSWTNTTAM